MLEQIIEKFEFMNSLIDILNPLELYEFLNHQKMLEVVDSLIVFRSVEQPKTTRNTQA